VANQSCAGTDANRRVKDKYRHPGQAIFAVHQKRSHPLSKPFATVRFWAAVFDRRYTFSGGYDLHRQTRDCRLSFLQVVPVCRQGLWSTLYFFHRDLRSLGPFICFSLPALFALNRSILQVDGVVVFRRCPFINLIKIKLGRQSLKIK
jgi:hypothetical protein